MMNFYSSALSFSFKSPFKTCLCVSLTVLSMWEIYSLFTNMFPNFKMRHKKLEVSKSTSDEVPISTDQIREVLFFRNEGTNCRTHVNKHDYTCDLGKYCGAYCLRTMLGYLEAVSEQLDVCLFHLTIRPLSNAILKAYRRGVSVRIITERTMYSERSQMPFLKHAGIPFRMQTDFAHCMHNKFVILDKKILMTGSLNWTYQGMCGNWDNLIIMSNPSVVKKYLNEFDTIWSKLARDRES